MAGSHDLNSESLGLMLDQIDQETEPRRVNAVLDFLDEVKRRRRGAEQRGKDCQEPKRAIRCTQSRDAPPVLFHQSQEQSTCGISIEYQVIHVHWSELTNPLQEDLLHGSIGTDGGQHGGEVFTLIPECRLPRRGGNPHLGRRQIQEPKVPQLMKYRTRNCSCFPAVSFSVLRDLEQDRHFGRIGFRAALSRGPSFGE